MRIVLSTLLLVAYLGLVLRPSMPLLEYELRKDFIASELCVNQDVPASCCKGSCYLTQRLKEAAGEKAPNTEVEEQITVPAHLWSSIILPESYNRVASNSSPSCHLLPGTPATPPTPPPKGFS